MTQEEKLQKLEILKNCKRSLAVLENQIEVLLDRDTFFDACDQTASVSAFIRKAEHMLNNINVVTKL